MEKKRQVVFIMTDTTRWDMVGCYGYPDMKTPCIDALAREGVRYDKAYTCQPVCGPARSAIFTGLFPHSNGSFTNTVPLLNGVKTAGEYLTPENVHCAYIGKWHLDGGDYFGSGICPPGYDDAYWYDMRRYLDELSPGERLKSRKENSSLEDGGIDAEFTFARRVSNRALDFLENHGGEDFFLCVSYDEPHQPYLCPEPFASMYKDYEMPKTPNYYDTLEGKPLYQKLWAGDSLHEDKSKLSVKPQLFLGCNSFVDSEIGRVIDRVKRSAPDAMIIFTSDHGEALGAHSLTLKGPTVYEEVAHIPLIIKGGAYCRSPEGAVYPSVATHIDMLPTILDYFDIPTPPVLQGTSMRPVIEDPEHNKLHDTVFCEFHRYEIDHDGFGGIQFMRAAVTDTDKLAVHLLDETDELYDTVNDRYEMNNLINDPDKKELRDTLHQRIIDFMNNTRDPYRGYQWEVRPWNSAYRRPSWEVDGFTRQRPAGPGEQIQLDYDTGLEITETVRFKKKADKPAGQV
ncbi:sulfatase-like hydrolase/transferase [Breznakiella homolactica]|uniref:Sulfatase-like hydrolase/transferase n=1 Tax=Breznakiella homolactica TaxID=2798577 RepID=A0A7T8B9F0_9SPIR|nr:sulfatase-like hydrolase/transferase [Breznakiella homolactica]QQO07895.1 sulfatase-like hydrolase/transferase [Breznakiella homolactica]